MPSSGFGIEVTLVTSHIHMHEHIPAHASESDSIELEWTFSGPPLTVALT